MPPGGGSDALYRAVVEQSPLSTMVFAPDGRPILVNPAYRRMWGVSDEMLATLLAQYNILEDPALEEQGVAEYIRRGFAGESVEVPLIHYRASPGSSSDIGVKDRWTKGFLYPLRERDGSIAEVVLVHEDVTERIESERRAEDLKEQLHRSEKARALGLLASGTAHDFNNLLTIIMCHAEVAFSHPQLRSSSLATIRETVTHASALTRSLLDLGHGDADGERRPTEVTELIGATVRALRQTLGRDITITFDEGREELWLEADASRLQQVVVNLCLNARDAMPHGGAIRLVVVADAATVHLRVSDTGSGIPPTMIRRVFEPFFTTKPMGKGTGLGLAMVRTTVEDHGGTVSVDSTDEGATFSIVLPRSTKPAVRQSSAPVPLDGAGELVLLVDDDAGVRAALAALLESARYRVVQAGNGRDALNLFEASADEVELVVSDVVMPTMNGPSLLRAARSLKPEQKALFISGYVDPDLKREVRNLQVDLLGKPFSKRMLLTRVRSLLG